ncbi:MAG TPA: hypothetical protein VGP93_11980 [Polyangiaceae bacterium]|nr:hypothetical protein [Polyangiaceae bacterium]
MRLLSTLISANNISSVIQTVLAAQLVASSGILDGSGASSSRPKPATATGAVPPAIKR